MHTIVCADGRAFADAAIRWAVRDDRSDADKTREESDKI